MEGGAVLKAASCSSPLFFKGGGVPLTKVISDEFGVRLDAFFKACDSRNGIRPSDGNADIVASAIQTFCSEIYNRPSQFSKRSKESKKTTNVPETTTASVTASVIKEETAEVKPLPPEPVVVGIDKDEHYIKSPNILKVERTSQQCWRRKMCVSSPDTELTVEIFDDAGSCNSVLTIFRRSGVCLTRECLRDRIVTDCKYIRRANGVGFYVCLSERVLDGNAARMASQSEHPFEAHLSPPENAVGSDRRNSEIDIWCACNGLRLCATFDAGLSVIKCLTFSERPRLPYPSATLLCAKEAHLLLCAKEAEMVYENTTGDGSSDLLTFITSDFNLNVVRLTGDMDNGASCLKLVAKGSIQKSTSALLCVSREGLNPQIFAAVSGDGLFVSQITSSSLCWSRIPSVSSSPPTSSSSSDLGKRVVTAGELTDAIVMSATPAESLSQIASRLDHHELQGEASHAHHSLRQKLLDRMDICVRVVLSPAEYINCLESLVELISDCEDTDSLLSIFFGQYLVGLIHYIEVTLKKAIGVSVCCPPSSWPQCLSLESLNRLGISPISLWTSQIGSRLFSRAQARELRQITTSNIEIRRYVQRYSLNVQDLRDGKWDDLIDTLFDVVKIALGNFMMID